MRILNLPSTNVVAFNGTVQNGGLIDTGIGTLVLGGSNTYTLGTLVNGGKLQFNTTNSLGAWAGGQNITNLGGALIFNFPNFMFVATTGWAGQRWHAGADILQLYGEHQL